MRILKKDNARWPKLDTLIMIEETVLKHTGNLDRREIWLKLPKKVMWQTFLVALDYLEKVDRISKESGKLVFIGKKPSSVILSTTPSYVY